MVNILQFILTLLTLRLPAQKVEVHSQDLEFKSVAIVGAGSAGLAMLKSLLDLPKSTRQAWNIVLFEQRSGLGGIWLPDSKPSSPPKIPETPLYPLLRTNTPVPSMSYPGFPFRPGTPLYPSHEHIKEYHERYASHFNLTQCIRFRHKVLKTSWVGTSEAGHWNITFRDSKEKLRTEAFHHLVVATGNNHIPRIPTWPGQREWVDNSPPEGPKREILHSVWYREPQRYLKRGVLIVGTGASGRDAASQISPLAKKTYVSVRHAPDPKNGPIPDGVQLKPEISHFTTNAVVFRDGTSSIVDAVLLATGYELRKPFLDEGNALVTDPSAHSNLSYTQGLVTNLQYLFPLHAHIFSLCPSYPTNALAFIGLPSGIANCPSDIAQSLFVTHAILNTRLLPSRRELLKDLAAREQCLRDGGYDPYSLGHKLPNGTSSDYQDDLIAYLKDNGAIFNDGKPYVESWRRDILTYIYLKRGWKRIEELGTQLEWLEGVETEGEWASLMRRINIWQEEWEREQNIPYARDWDLVG